MATLKQQTKLKTDGLTQRYSGVPVLYLESKTDRYIYAEVWFRDHQKSIEFTAVDDACRTAGCKAVIEHVQTQRDQGNPAWGVVDRDALMTHDYWDLVWETDDIRYCAEKPFGSYIKATLLWELESYLADAEVLEAYTARTQLRDKRLTEQVYSELCEHCEALVPHAAYNAMAHEYRKRQLPDGMTDQFSDRQAVETHLQSKMLSDCTEDEKKAYNVNIKKVDQFANQNGASLQNLESMKRRIHGKALLSRWVKQCKLTGTLSHHIGHLAEELSSRNRIPDELRSFLSDISSQP